MVKLKNLAWRKVGFIAACAILVFGLGCLGYAAWLVYGTSYVTAKAKNDLVKKVEAEIPTMVGSPQAVSPRSPKSSSPSISDPKVVIDQAFGLVRIPRFGATYVQPLIESTDEKTLELGVGHYVGTALPCGVGNFSMAGHRTTYGAPFNKIDSLRTGDHVIIQTKQATCTYRVTGHEIVLPTAVRVIAPVADHPGRRPVSAMMTMTSCNPKYSAAQRYVVHGVLVKEVSAN